MKPLTSVLAVLFVLCVASRAQSRTWYVTVDYTGDVPTIQAAIDTAVAGDEVLVAPGTYTWTNQFISGSRMIIMKSGIWLHSEGGPEITVLDAERQGGVIYCDGVDDQATIQGFTITGAETGSTTGSGGAGILCRGSSPSIVDNIITGNSYGNGWIRNGGGISCYMNSSPAIIDNTISFNTSYEGGGIALASSSNATIEGNTVHHNYTQPPELDWQTRGGGIHCVDSTPEILGNVISENLATYGGGVYLRNSSPTVELNLIKGNRAGTGAAIMCSGGAPIIARNTIVDSEAHGLYGYLEGGAIYFANQSSGYVWSNIIATTGYGSALSCELGSGPNIACNDLWANLGGDGDCDTSDPTNFQSDPLFCDPASGNYFLREDSPCVDISGPFPCLGTVGAFGVGCEPLRVEQTTWGRVKAHYHW